MTISLKPGSVFTQDGFTFGTATSSFQIEGGAEFREKSIWDTFCEQPGKIADASHGQLACDHYHKWQEDIALIHSLGFDAYRFSVSWPRIIRQDGSIDQAGLDFYIAILDELNRLNIKPYVTLYHWDLPQYLEDNGGWLNRDTADAFAIYTDVVTQAFGSRVYSYATLNEPFCSAYLGYELGIHAPGIVGKEFGKKAIHHLLLAHGKAMKVLRENSPTTLNGIVLNFTPFYPATASEADTKAANLAHTHFNDWYIRPLLVGQYPNLINHIPQSHRPEIMPGDMEIIAQEIDFLGVNYYTRGICEYCSEEGFKQLAPAADTETTAMGWEVYPQGLTDLLVGLHQAYELPPLYITENGLASDDVMHDGEVLDAQRIKYLQHHLDAVADAATQGVVINGYFVWSLMDNFEWAEGYEKRFGIVHVDYETLVRTPKQSAILFSSMLKKRALSE